MCPLFKKPCEKVAQCEWRYEGIRFFENGEKKPFRECAILYGISCLEGILQRLTGVQQATEGARNQTGELKSFFEGLATLKALEHKDER